MFHIKLFLTCSIFGLGVQNLTAQETNSSLPDSTRLKIVFPSNGDTLNFDRIRFAGSVSSNATVWVQNKRVKVYPSGAFVGMTDLALGWNSIFFAAQGRTGKMIQTIQVFRERLEYPAVPTAISQNRIKPSGDIYISSGDNLEVEFWGSPGGQATFSLNRIAKNVKMQEVPKRRNGGLRGLYKGSIEVPELQRYLASPVQFKLRGKNGRVVKMASPGKVRVLATRIPIVGITSDSLNVIRYGINDKFRMELPPEVKLEIIGERGGFKKVKFSENKFGYIDTKSLKMLPFGWPFPYASMGGISVVEIDDGLQIQVYISEKVPFEIAQMTNPPALEVKFYHTNQAPQWVKYLEGDAAVKTITWRRESDEIVVLRVELIQGQQWGFRGDYVEDQFRLKIRKAPKLSTDPDSLLRGIRFIIDPGHGGEFEGAVGSTGLQEKTVNLKYAKAVADLLKQAGATVFMTRNVDSTVALATRVAFSRKTQSHIFLSLHNNSISPQTEPLRPRGTSTYFSTPQSRAIAASIYRKLLDINLRPFGSFNSEFFLTRQTDLISVLIEGAFLTHPQDEMLLLDAEFLNKMADAIVAGIKDFILDQQIAQNVNQLNKTVPSKPVGLN